MSEPERHLAVLFADVSGSTRLYDTLGDSAAHRIVVQLLERLGAIAASEGGRVVKQIGDEVLVVFGDPASAVDAACAMQRSFARSVRSPDAPAGIRVGLQHGPVLERAGDVFGDTVNVAARMVALAKAGQILTTRECAERLPPRIDTRYLDRTRVAGKEGELEVFEVLWGRASLTSFEAIPVPEAGAPRALSLCLGGREYRVSAESPTLTIGRDTSDVEVPLRVVSRRHARIEWRRGRPVLVDESTNGTLVVPDGAPPTFVRRDQLPLEGSGIIAPGFEPGAHPDRVLRYVCET